MDTNKTDLESLSYEEMQDLRLRLEEVLSEKLYDEATKRAERVAEDLAWLWKNRLIARRMIRALSRHEDGSINIDCIRKSPDEDGGEEQAAHTPEPKKKRRGRPLKVI